MEEDKSITLAQRYIHHKAIFLWVHSPSTIPIGDLFFLRISPAGKEQNLIEICSRGLNNPAKYSNVPRPKFIKKAKSLLPKKSQIPMENQKELVI